MSARYALGIDLGTTNSALAYTALDGDRATVELLPVPQVVAPSTVEARELLPSFLYRLTEGEREAGGFDPPGQQGAGDVVGVVARDRAADHPERTVAAAKSWLCNSRVDRRAPILPWGAPDEVGKRSPVEAARRYLEHLREAWQAAFPEAPFAEQAVTLTVPASFDAGARDLTREAALLAGYPEDLVLLEEPQAALYAWLAAMGDLWRRRLKVGDSLLVCDVGGGTSDFTLIGVEEKDGELQLSRKAVGRHILVGGDNMDLALAHLARERFAERGVRADAWQSVALWHACRAAKERLLGDESLEAVPVTLLGRGRKVIGGSVSIELSRDEVLACLVDGFFPLCAADERPARRASSGLREIGLPYESDAAITRHLAAFLGLHAGDAGTGGPSHVLFNGGVFKASAFQRRLMEALGSWRGGQAPALLEGRHDLDYAVARGAAFYGHAKRQGGVRIRGGIPRTYYVGIETSGPAVPGAPRPLRALCVAPRGMEEGASTDVPGLAFELAVGEPAHFRFFSSTVREGDRPGAMIDAWEEGEIEETDSLEARLPASEAYAEDYVPVRVETRVTELGVLELWCVSTVSDERWKLEFSVRQDA